ncbi:MAG: hypothetical protein ACXW36_00240 [Nitrospira sp.]
MLVGQDCTEGTSLHPATDEFMERFLAFREQLERNHPLNEDHVGWETELQELERALRSIRERIVSGTKI